MNRANGWNGSAAVLRQTTTIIHLLEVTSRNLAILFSLLRSIPVVFEAWIPIIMRELLCLFEILCSTRLPSGRAESGFFDPISNLNDRALYVEGRSILRIGGIPGPPPFQPPPGFDLLDLASILEA
jgi:hypothetical protein